MTSFIKTLFQKKPTTDDLLNRLLAFEAQEAEFRSRYTAALQKSVDLQKLELSGQPADPGEVAQTRAEASDLASKLTALQELQSELKEALQGTLEDDRKASILQAGKDLVATESKLAAAHRNFLNGYVDLLCQMEKFIGVIPDADILCGDRPRIFEIEGAGDFILAGVRKKSIAPENLYTEIERLKNLAASLGEKQIGESDVTAVLDKARNGQ